MHCLLDGAAYPSNEFKRTLPLVSFPRSRSLHIAFSSVALGQCPAALNAGVNLLLTPNTTAMTLKAGMLALDGRCKTLSPSADGYARADTCGAMLLLPPALVGEGAALSLVAGSAVNQDGRSSSLTAPNGPSQQDVVRLALASSQLPPTAVTALQMHGTGARNACAAVTKVAGLLVWCIYSAQ